MGKPQSFPSKLLYKKTKILNPRQFELISVLKILHNRNLPNYSPIIHTRNTKIPVNKHNKLEKHLILIQMQIHCWLYGNKLFSDPPGTIKQLILSLLVNLLDFEYSIIITCF